MKKFLAIFFVFVTVIFQCGCTNSFNFRNEYDRGMRAYNEKDYESAIVYFNNALNYKPDSYSTLCLLGTSYAYNKDENMAERTFQDAIRLFPDSWNAYVFYGDLKRAQHDYVSAIDNYETAITLGSMGGKEKAYYKKLLKEIKIEESSYLSQNTYAARLAKEEFQDSKGAAASAKKQMLIDKKNSLTPIVPVDPTGDVVLGLDAKAWEKSLDQKDEKSRVIQYSLKGEDIKNLNWTKLAVIQYFVLSDNYKTTLDEYFKNHTGAIEAVAKSSNKPFEKKIIHQKSNEITYEWKFDNAKESEISRILYTEKGIYHIHFAKKGAFTDAEKARFLDLLKTAQFK